MGSSGMHFLLLLKQAAHSVRRLSAHADPIIGAFYIERTVLTGLLGIVCTDDLDEFPVAWAAAIGHHYSVVGPVLRTFSA